MPAVNSVPHRHGSEDPHTIPEGAPQVPPHCLELVPHGPEVKQQLSGRTQHQLKLGTWLMRDLWPP